MEAYKLIEHRNGMKEIVPITNVVEKEFVKLQKSEDNFRREMRDLRKEYNSNRKDSLNTVLMSAVTSLFIVMMIWGGGLLAVEMLAISPIIVLIVVLIMTILTIRLLMADVKHHRRLNEWYKLDRERILKTYGLR